VNRSVSFSDVSSSNNADDFSTDRPWQRDRRFRALPKLSWKPSVRHYLPKSLSDEIIAAGFSTATMSTAQIVTGKRRTGTRAIITKAFKKVALFPDMRDRWVTCETWASEINKRF
jgi:hypothetical protein